MKSNINLHNSLRGKTQNATVQFWRVDFFIVSKLTDDAFAWLIDR